MQGEKIWTACLLIIGDEILSGRTQDANLSYLAKWLNSHGIRLSEARVIADDEDAIVIALNAVRAQYDYVFTTGGIGPTHDDITAASIAKAFGVPLVHQPEAVQLLHEYYGDKITEERLSMALMPEGAQLIPNKASGAPGFRIGNVIILAGIPSIMRAMLEGLAGQLEGGRPVLSRTIGAYVAESEIATTLSKVQDAHDNVMIGSYPFFKNGKIGANFVLRSTMQGDLDAAAQDLLEHMEYLGFSPFDQEI
ncbi:MAG: molybdopterin-binding protein [Sphingomonadales bacterium]|jgi:molybdenum cofactor synthesis domain-containing protein